MTVYVDDAKIRAQVGRWNTQWSHMFADTKEELHEFAAKLGLKRAWFQDKPNGLWHYDVTESKRQLAIRMGVTQCTWREAVEIMRKRDGVDAEPTER